MAYKATFERYELKYILSFSQKERLLQIMQPFMSIDDYGRTVIRNIYFDTENYRLIRRSIEKPIYKEKLRIRSYGRASAKSKVFVELKRKYESVVYKRRISLTEEEAMRWLQNENDCKQSTQIGSEIDYFLKYYKTLRPKVFLSYERDAYYSLCGDDFRVTFDENILCRQNDLSLCAEIGGTPLLKEETVLMEIKCSGGIPLWMTRFLTEEKIYKTSFSKYGTAYEKIIYPNLQEELAYA